MGISILQVVKHGHILGPHHQGFIDGYIMGMMKLAMLYRQQNVQLEVKTIHYTESLNHLLSQQQGFIIIATELEAGEIVGMVESLRAPAVIIDAIYDHLPYDFVDMNNTDVIYEIVRHLAKQGCKALSFVGGKQNTRNFYMREIALESACDHYDLDLKRRYSIDPYEDPDALEMQKLLQSYAPTEALICANDYIAYNCIKALHAMNYRIPQDVAIVGFDNLSASPLFQPPLSSVEIPKQEIGGLALARLITIINKQQFGLDTQRTKNIGTIFPSPFEATVKQKLSCRFIPRNSSRKDMF